MRQNHIALTVCLALIVGAVLLAGSWSARDGATPAGAQRNDGQFDVRGADSPTEPTGEQRQALRRLEARAGAEVSAHFSRLTGSARRILARGGFLSSPASGDPEQIARDFLAANADLFAAPPGFVAALEEPRSHLSDSSGLMHVEFRQKQNGLSVFQSILKIAVTADGRVLNVAGEYYPDLPDVGTSPALSRSDALDAAFSHVGAGAPAVPDTPDANTITAALAPSAELLVFPLARGEAKLAWRVLIPGLAAYWDVVIGADDGALLYSDDLATHTGPEGQVFAEHPDASTLTTVPFVGELAPPRDAWVGPTSLSACTTCSNGNNVAAISDRDGDLAGPLAFDPDAHFNFGFADSFALTGNPDPDEEASITNLFYLVNVSHDYFYDLGFTEAAGNFQDDNFGAGGTDGDPVLATTYSGYDSCPYLPTFNCANNAFFAAAPEGNVPILSTFLFTGTNRDPSFDGDIIFHEYAHGVSTRLVGVGNLGGVQSGAMGEGWSDYFAISYYDDPVMGEYSTQDAVSGIRRYAYDSSPLTYGGLCDGGCDVHDDGEIWAAALWDLRQFYVDTLGSSAGRDAADRLIVEALKLTPPDPSFLDARDALLQAEQATGGAYEDDLWAVFAARGMGCSATSDGDSETVTEAFNVPVDGSCPDPPPPTPTPSPTATPQPTPTPEPDADGDGVLDDVDNCPLWYNPSQTLPPWPVPEDDPDCDGFDDFREAYVATDATAQCPANTAHEAWPADLDNNRTVNIIDVLTFKQVFGADVPPASPRFDLNPSGSIDLLDVLALKPFFATSCTPG